MPARESVLPEGLLDDLPRGEAMDRLIVREDQRRQERSVRDGIRSEVREELLQCARRSETAMSVRDVETFMHALKEDQLRGPELRTDEQKEGALRAFRDKWAADFIKKTEEKGREALTIIENAEKKKWITHESAERWRRRLKTSQWPASRDFIETTLPAWSKDWEKLAFDFNEVGKECKKCGIDMTKVSALAPLTEHGFRDRKYLVQKNLVDKAKAVLAVLQKSGAGKEEMKKLYESAEKQLQGAVDKGALAEWKIGTWMRRIFESSAKPEKIKQFLNGEGNMPLSQLIQTWLKARKRFDAIEDERKRKGAPRTFHFVHIDVFLDWKLPKREAYLREAEHRLQAIDISKERDDFLKIRHALDTEDWDEAEILIARASMAPDLTAKDKERLSSMANFLRQHRDRKPAGAEQQGDTPEEVLLEMRALVDQLPPSLQKIYIEMLRRGYQAFWAFTTLMYNRVWCHEHHYLDPVKENVLHARSKVPTHLRIRDGHGGGFEVNDMTGGENNTKAAVRDQRNVSAPQLIFIDENTSVESLGDKIEEGKDNRNFWYWATLAHTGVDYNRHQHYVKNLHPEMKRLARKMQKTGTRYTHTGNPQFQGTTRTTNSSVKTVRFGQRTTVSTAALS